MAFLDHIRACNNFDAGAFRPFLIGEHRAGCIRHDLAGAFDRWPDVFRVAEDAVRLDDSLDDFETRSDAVAGPLRQLADEGGITGWRGEIYPVKPDWHAPPLMQLERVLVNLDAALGTMPAFDSAFYSPDSSRANYVSAPRPFEHITVHGGYGHPELATPEKGEALLDVAVAQVVAFVNEFATWSSMDPR